MDFVHSDGTEAFPGRIVRVVFFNKGEILLDLPCSGLYDAEEGTTVEKVFTGLHRAKTVKLDRNSSFYKADKDERGHKGYALYINAPLISVVQDSRDCGEELRHFKVYKFGLRVQLRYETEPQDHLTVEVFTGSEQTPFGKKVEFYRAKLQLQGIKTKNESWVSQLVLLYDLKPQNELTYFLQAPQTAEEIEASAPVQRFQTVEKLAVGLYRMGNVARLGDVAETEVTLVPTQAFIESLGRDWWSRLIEDYRR